MKKGDNEDMSHRMVDRIQIEFQTGPTDRINKLGSVGDTSTGFIEHRIDPELKTHQLDRTRLKQAKRIIPELNDTMDRHIQSYSVSKSSNYKPETVNHKTERNIFSDVDMQGISFVSNPRIPQVQVHRDY